MPSRRDVLAACSGIAVALVAGCSSDSSGSTDAETPSPTPTPDSSGGTDTETSPPITTAGFFGGTGTETETPSPTRACSAIAPPAPTDAATSPRSYPERPSELKTETLRQFLTEYERAFQYNDELATNPDKVGRTNEYTVHVESVSVQTDDGRFTADLSGQLQSDIIVEEAGTTTPATPTETPLPIGHAPFETSYVVTDRYLERESVIVECW